MNLTEEGLASWGRRLGEVALREEVFVCLYGELGAGKSTLARAACRGAGIAGPVPSPTFTLVNVYAAPGGRPVRHADLYRLTGPEQLWDIGWEDLLAGEGMVLAEWADRAGPHLPRDRWEIRLEMSAGPGVRVVTASAIGSAPPIPAPPSPTVSTPSVGSRAGEA